MSCPRCMIGVIEGGTGCVVCNFCRSVYDLGFNYMFTYKKEYKKKEVKIWKG